MKAIHTIEFMLNEDVAMRILYAIAQNFCCPTMDYDNGETYFNISLSKENAIEFYDMYSWAMTEICDMDQDDGGAFI